MKGRRAIEDLCFLLLVLGVAAFPLYVLLFAPIPGAPK